MINVKLKYKTYSFEEYKAAGVILDEGQPVVTKDGPNNFNIYIGTGGPIETATYIASYKDMETLVKSEVALLNNGLQSDLSNHKVITPPVDGIIYSSEIGGVNKELFTQDSNIGPDGWIGEAYENLVLEDFKDTFILDATDNSSLSALITGYNIAPNETAYIHFDVEVLNDGGGSNTVYCYLLGAAEGNPTGGLSVRQDGIKQSCTIEVHNTTSFDRLVQLYPGNYNSTLDNVYKFSNLFVTTKPNLPYNRDKRDATIAKISTSNLNKKQGQLVFNFNKYDAFNQYLFDGRTSLGIDFLLQINSIGKFELYANNNRVYVSALPKAGDIVSVIWDELSGTKVYINGLQVMSTAEYPRFSSDELTIGARFNFDSLPYANANLIEFAYLESITPTDKLLADSRNIYYPDGTFRDGFGQVRDKKDSTPRRTLADLYDPINTDTDMIYIHDKHGAIDKNFALESEYEFNDNRGLGVFGEYENEGYIEGLQKHGTAEYTLTPYKNGFRINVTKLSTANYIAMLVEGSTHSRYLTYRVDSFNSEVALQKGTVDTNYVISKLPDGRFQIEIPANESVWLADNLMDVGVYDIMVTTIPNAPYVKDRHKTDNPIVSIEKWNKSRGCLSFALNSDINEGQYIFDSRTVANSTLDFTMLLAPANYMRYHIGDGVFHTSNPKAGTKIDIVWVTGNTKVFYNNEMVLNVNKSPKFLSGVLNLGRRYQNEPLTYINAYLKHFSYSTSMPTKLLTDPRFILKSNGQFEDEEGNSRGVVKLKKDFAKAVEVEKFIIGEDIPFENLWEIFSTNTDYTPTIQRNGNHVSFKGLIRFGVSSTTICVLPESCRPKQQMHLGSTTNNHDTITINITTDGLFRAYFTGSPGYISIACSFTIGE